uniref:Late embryogenesis abundant protein LEA-2 subgroup domain-containing protein n=1 Tax=Oryza rufipogon TaxID=4529 RepID=A0A0E0N320_ORYRU
MSGTFTASPRTQDFVERKPGSIVERANCMLIMAHGEDLDLEAAEAAAPYHALQGDLREHDEASGRRCSQACLLWTLGLLGLTMFLSTFAFFSTTTRPAATPTLGGRYYHDHDAFSVSIAGYEGIDPGSAGAAVSPAFRVTLGTANGACVDRAAVTVLYSGVALGWAHAEPRDCAAGRRERDVEVVARGQGVGLSERLRGRMASEWRSSGALVLDIDVKAFDEVTSPAYAARHVPDRLIICKVTLDEQGSDSSACPCSNRIMALITFVHRSSCPLRTTTMITMNKQINVLDLLFAITNVRVPIKSQVWYATSSIDFDLYLPASPVRRGLIYLPPMGAGLVEDEDRRRDCLDGHPHIQCAVTVILMAICLALPVYGCWASVYGYKTPDFWVKVPGIEGLERGPSALAAPVFNVTLRVDNEATRRPFCTSRASAAVSYAGVQLGHVDLPGGFCVPGQVVSSVPIVATSDGLGIPSELYERMESQRRWHERVSLEVQVRLDDCCGQLPVMLWRTAVVHGQPQGPFLCKVSPMLKDGEPRPPRLYY